MFIPKKCLAGFNRRAETYTKKLAYVIYWDEKGVLRKQRSWEQWIQKDEGRVEFDNEPREGFVLNKKVGGYATGWNHRSTKVRVYDPLGFEMELSVENLLYILEHTSCIQGKGLDGKFIYAWMGTELWLLPCSDPCVEEWQAMADRMFNPEVTAAKDLKIGHTYLTKSNNKYIYLGSRRDTKNKKKHIFCLERRLAGYTTTFKTKEIVKDLGDYAKGQVHLYEPIFDYAPEFNNIGRVEQVVITPEMLVEAYKLYTASSYNNSELNGIRCVKIIYYHSTSGAKSGNPWRSDNSVHRWLERKYGKKNYWGDRFDLPDNFVPTLEQAKEAVEHMKPALTSEFFYENGKSHIRLDLGSGHEEHGYIKTLNNLTKGVNWDE